LKVKDDDIVRFLKSQHGWVTADTLASQFNVSDRTIRNHLRQINDAHELVVSGPLGYRLSTLHRQTVAVNNRGNMALPLSERVFLALMNSNREQIQTLQFIQDAYVSESSLRDAVKEFNQHNAKHRVSINERSGALQLNGSESAKRYVLKQMIQGDNSGMLQAVNLQNVQRMIPNIPIDDLERLINQVVNRDSLTINQYQLYDLLMHYAISINRIQSAQAMTKLTPKHAQLKARKEYELTLQIVDRITERYHVKFTTAELDGLTLALIGKTIIKDFASVQLSNLNDYIPQQVINATVQTLQKADNEYGQHLSNPAFSVKFIIHVNNVRDRMIYKKVNEVKDTQAFDTLKKEYPLYYELALFIGQELTHRLDLHFSSQELTYIVLHLGAYLNSDHVDKINTVLISPSYYDIGEKLREQLSTEFGQDIQISAMYSTLPLPQGTAITSKLVITTVDLDTGLDESNYVIKINPFMTRWDKDKIRQTIDQIHQRNQTDQIVSYFSQYSSPADFLLDPEIDHYEALFKQVAERMQERGYVGADYYDKLLEREKLAPTNFGNIAVPHALNLKAKKTGIFVVLDHQGITWSSARGKVNLIFFIAVSQDNQRFFSIVLQNLINLLSIKENVEQILQSTNYAEFKTTLMTLMKGGIESNV
jgi:lichenan operon transcriptional antiterminator